MEVASQNKLRFSCENRLVKTNIAEKKKIIRALFPKNMEKKIKKKKERKKTM